MYYLTDKLYPDWHMKEFYNRNIMLPYAFRTDASEYTRSMSSELNTVDEINDSFDDIAYDKGRFMTFNKKRKDSFNLFSFTQQAASFACSITLLVKKYSRKH